MVTIGLPSINARYGDAAAIQQIQRIQRIQQIQQIQQRYSSDTAAIQQIQQRYSDPSVHTSVREIQCQIQY